MITYLSLPYKCVWTEITAGECKRYLRSGSPAYDSLRRNNIDLDHDMGEDPISEFSSKTLWFSVTRYEAE